MKDKINPQSFEKNNTNEDRIIDALKVIADSKKKLKRFDDEQADIFRILKKDQERKESLHEKLQEFSSDDEKKAEIDRIKSELFDLERSECGLSDESYVYSRCSAIENSQIRNAIETLNSIPLFCAIKSHLLDFPDYQSIFDGWI